jgi:hypothetical protein
MPSGGAGAIDLLNHLPETNVNLAHLPVDRLRTFLDAFAVQLHYNLPDNSVTIEATISVDAIPHLGRLAHNATHRETVPARTTAARQRPRQRQRALMR